MKNPNEQTPNIGDFTAPKKKGVPRSVRTDVQFSETRIVPVYFGTEVAHALRAVSEDMDIYRGVKLGQLLEFVYDQGKKDGARFVFDSVDELKKVIPHRNPGQPKKLKKTKRVRPVLRSESRKRNSKTQ